MIRNGRALEPLRILTSRIKMMYSGNPTKYSKREWNALFTEKEIMINKS